MKLEYSKFHVMVNKEIPLVIFSKSFLHIKQCIEKMRIFGLLKIMLLIRLALLIVFTKETYNMTISSSFIVIMLILKLAMNNFMKCLLRMSLVK